jgi:NitT/TauT family transport system substrate-binding protein
MRIQVYPGTILNLPQWVMVERGFCAAHNLQCETIAIPSGPVGLQALAAGSVEVTYASTDVTMQSAARGNDVVVFAGHSPNNIYELSVRADLPLPHRDAGYPAVMKDLVGKRLGVTARGAATEIQVRALMIGAQLDPDSVTYVAVGSPATSYPAMLANQIDAAVMFQPFRTLCETQKTCFVAVDFAKGEGPPELKALNGGFETFATRRDLVQRNPAAADNFILALREAIDWMQKPENFDEVLAITKKNLSLGDIPNAEDTLKTLVRNQIPRFGVTIDRASVKAFSDFLLKFKLIEAPVNPARFVYERAP